MRGALVLAMVLAGIVAMPERAAAAPPVVPGLVQAADTDGDGWALCWERGGPMRFWCPVYPRLAAVEVRVNWWHYAKCAAAIIAWVATNVTAYGELKKVGGAWKVAKRVWKAKGHVGKAKVLGAIFTDLSGLGGVIDACGG
jgi:hypothetical protein